MRETLLELEDVAKVMHLPSFKRPSNDQHLIALNLTGSLTIHCNDPRTILPTLTIDIAAIATIYKVSNMTWFSKLELFLIFTELTTKRLLIKLFFRRLSW